MVLVVFSVVMHFAVFAALLLLSCGFRLEGSWYLFVSALGSLYRLRGICGSLLSCC